MRRIFTSKQERKQAEDAIIRDMRKILSGLEDYRRQKDEAVDKAQVMSVLTQFVKLKSESQIN